MKKSKLICLIIGIVFILTSFTMMIINDAPTMHSDVFTFASTYKDKNVTLKGTFYEVKDSEYAVLICPGYSCDRQKWRPMSNLFVKNGISTMIFDYAGQGGSYQTIGFDNAKTDAIPVEIDDAIEELHLRSGVDYDHIILMGHSMGGRSILRLLFDYNSDKAITTVTKKPIKNVILFSPEVNYVENIQAGLFAGTSDDVDYPWVYFDEDSFKGTNIYLFGSTADDVVDDESILQIFKHMGGQNLPTKGVFEDSQITKNGDKITVGITRGILHSYQMYSPEFATFANNSVKDITGIEPKFSAPSILLVYLSWGFGLAGLFITLLGLNMDYKVKEDDENVPDIIDSKKFLIRKLIMWLPGLLVAFLVCCICIIMPFGSPIMNIPYMCFIAGYGLLMLFLYRKGTFKGTNGKMPKVSFKINASKKSLISCIAITIALCFFVWFILKGSMYNLVPFNFRIFWLVFATLLMSVGYYISGVEGDMLNKANAKRKVRFLYSLIQYVPLFLFVLFYLIIKSYSGVIGQGQNLVLMYIFCIPLGTFIKNKTGNRLYGALSSAFLFQVLMITSAALISFF